MNWYRENEEEVVSKTGSNVEVGITTKEAKKRLNQVGQTS